MITINDASELTAEKIMSMSDEEMDLIPDTIWEQIPSTIWDEIKAKRNQQAVDAAIADYEREIISNLKDASLMDSRYTNCSFDTCEIGDNPEFNNAYARCKRYCTNAAVILQKNLGIYIYGDVGVGKTHLIACMANQLMKSGYKVLFTNISSLIKRITSTFNGSKETEEDIMKSLKLVDFLFIDDIGSEQADSQFAKSKIYDMINLRYSIRKPVIFTSNQSIRELFCNGYEQKTIDRINELSSVVLKITGKSRRLRKQEVTDF
ncbi:MAG: ATP-binding protein [Erysipelotrichales bacterium]|nr:ATP-binding protein [Erysipelotrichales bacterium]